MWDHQGTDLLGGFDPTLGPGTQETTQDGKVINHLEHAAGLQPTPPCPGPWMGKDWGKGEGMGHGSCYSREQTDMVCK